jgi:hypothetical protein
MSRNKNRTLIELIELISTDSFPLKISFFSQISHPVRAGQCSILHNAFALRLFLFS